MDLTHAPRRARTQVQRTRVLADGSGWIAEVDVKRAANSWTLTGKSKERGEADAWLTLITELLSGGRGHPSFGELAELWMAYYHASSEYAPSTIRNKTGFVRNHVLPQLGVLEVDRIGVEVLSAFYQRLLDTRSEPLARRVRSVVAAIASLADWWGLVHEEFYWMALSAWLPGSSRNRLARIHEARLHPHVEVRPKLPD